MNAPNTQISDELIASFSSGNVNSFWQLMRSYWTISAPAVCFKAPGVEAQRKLLEEIWIRIFTRRQSLVEQTAGGFSLWLASITAEVLREYFSLAQNKLYSGVVSEDEIRSLMPTASEPPPEFILERHKIDSALAEFKKGLPLELQHIYHLRYEQHQQSAQIAAALGKPENKLDELIGKVIAASRKSKIVLNLVSQAAKEDRGPLIDRMLETHQFSLPTSAEYGAIERAVYQRLAAPPSVTGTHIASGAISARAASAKSGGWPTSATKLFAVELLAILLALAAVVGVSFMPRNVAAKFEPEQVFLEIFLTDNQYSKEPKIVRPLSDDTQLGSKNLLMVRFSSKDPQATFVTPFIINESLNLNWFFPPEGSQTIELVKEEGVASPFEAKMPNQQEKIAIFALFSSSPIKVEVLKKYIESHIGMGKIGFDNLEKLQFPVGHLAMTRYSPAE
jgi:DNA-directed RNA polymerase specialized sigma24 family protein